MKKPSPDHLQRAKRKQLAQTHRNLRASRKRKALRGQRASRAASSPSTLVPVPQHLRYYARREYRREIEAFFEHVDSLLQSGRLVTLDFSKLQKLYPCGLLVLMGWVDEWVAKHPGHITARYPRDELAEQMLQHVDVLQKLGLPARREISHNDVKRWHYFHGQNADATPIEPFMVELQTMLGEEHQLGLGNCVSEAMTNVTQHAYEPVNGGPWWIFATVFNKSVFIALYDRGESVPATLLAKPKFKDYLSGNMWLHGRGDGKLITAAVGGRTRTELPYRGKGLPEMLEFTKRFPNSELGIFSRNGFFRYADQESTGRLKIPMKGTLVIWTLNISANRHD